MMDLELQGSVVQDGSDANIKLSKYFNLYPDIKVFVDVPGLIEQGDEYTKVFSDVYEVSGCTTDIKIKTVLKDNCGQLTCKFIHKDCQEKFIKGSRIRLYLDNRCWFCGFIFTRNFESKDEMSVVAFDFLRYFKSPLIYSKTQMVGDDGKQGMVASDIFKKICSDLSIPFGVYTNSQIPVTPQNYSQKSGFKILEFAINQTLINSPKDDRQYFTYFHECNFEEDNKQTEKGEGDFSKTDVFKNSGTVIWHLRNNLTVDTVIDDEMIYKYNFKDTIDEQTYNEVILYKDQKTYLDAKGKTLKKGKKTGTQIVKVAKDNRSKALYGYLPYYHKAPDGYSEAQMEDTAKQLLAILDRPTHSLTLNCYGIIGMRAGYLVPVLIKDIGGTTIGQLTKDDKGNEKWEAVYRTVQECEMLIQYPLKMNLKISSGMYGEYDL